MVELLLQFTIGELANEHVFLSLISPVSAEENKNQACVYHWLSKGRSEDMAETICSMIEESFNY